MSAGPGVQDTAVHIGAGAASRAEATAVNLNRVVRRLIERAESQLSASAALRVAAPPVVCAASPAKVGVVTGRETPRSSG